MNLHFLPFFRDIGETDMAFDGIVISNVVRDMKETEGYIRYISRRRTSST